MSGWAAGGRSRRSATATSSGSRSYRADGSLRPFVRIWFVWQGDELFVRSAYGPENGWFRRAVASGTGRIRPGAWSATWRSSGPGRRRPVRSLPRTTPSTTDIAASIVRTVVSDDAVRCTLRLVPSP